MISSSLSRIMITNCSTTIRSKSNTQTRNLISSCRAAATSSTSTTSNSVRTFTSNVTTASTTIPIISNTIKTQNDKANSCIFSSSSLPSSLPSSLSLSNNLHRRTVTTLSLNSKKRRGKKITMATAYDYPSAMHVHRANIDVILVGDSCAMVELGYETTQPMTMEHMLHHCQAVKRGVNADNTNNNQPLLVGDMVFGTYEFADLDIALQNSYRMVKEGGMDAVKLEGGSKHRAKTIQHIVDGGVAVMGHIGLTPQAISVIGGFRAQGRTASRAREMIDEALRLQDAGAFAIVLECVPSNVAAAVTETLEIPTIGIGAGNGTSGQVLVYHDMLGMMSHPHHEAFMPKFCKQYAQVGHSITKGLEEFKKEVEDGTFPGTEYSPYVMNDEEKTLFDDLLQKDATERKNKHEQLSKKLKQADEYEQLSLYGKKSDS
jgi:3-methyl-2-oxobutanoate hydroxymethyltransferase